MSKFSRIIGRYATASVLTASVYIGCVVLLLIIVLVYDLRFAPMPDALWSESIVWSADREPLIVRSTRSEFVNSTSFQLSEEYFDIDRSPIQPPEDRTSALTLPSRLAFPDLTDDLGVQVREVNYRRSGATPRGENWFIVFERKSAGRAWFEGYDQATRRRVGYIGRTGFSVEPIDRNDQFVVNRFDYYSHWQMVTNDDSEGRFGLGEDQAALLSSDRVYLIDFRNRSVEPILDVPNAICLRVGRFGAGKESLLGGITRYDPLGGRMLAVRSEEAIHLIDPKTRRTVHFVLPPEVQERPFYNFLLSTDQAIAISRPGEESATPDDGYESTARLVWFANDGSVQRSEDIRLRQQRSMEEGERRERRIITALMLAPLPALLFIPSVMAFKASPRFWPSLIDHISEVWPVLLLLATVSAIFCWLVERWRKSHGEDRSLGWLAFVFLFSLPGYIGYRLHRRWPDQEALAPPERLASDVFA